MTLNITIIKCNTQLKDNQHNKNKMRHSALWCSALYTVLLSVIMLSVPISPLYWVPLCWISLSWVSWRHLFGSFQTNHCQILTVEENKLKSGFLQDSTDISHSLSASSATSENYLFFHFLLFLQKYKNKLQKSFYILLT
jgi:hypothetical protein